MLKKFSLTIACSIAFLLIGDYNITVVDRNSSRRSNALLDVTIPRPDEVLR